MPENIVIFEFSQTEDLGWPALRCCPATIQYQASREAQQGTLQSQKLRKKDIKKDNSFLGILTHMGDFTQGGEWLLKNWVIFFDISLNISIDGLQPTCMYQLRVKRGPQELSLNVFMKIFKHLLNSVTSSQLKIITS